ncbi:voltage-gated potassium channel [Aureococcus anophagefferens]|uniref:Voltage-gated potassium channel n=1 Tax=Aureococcus anophagefferens TaxID=44056 RepID=A0ABR1FNL5_AURAN
MSNHGQNLYVKCVDEAVIIFGKGVFRVPRRAPLVHRAMFGDADAPTMGLDGLAIFLALWGLFITSYLIGELGAQVGGIPFFRYAMLRSVKLGKRQRVSVKCWNEDDGEMALRARSSEAADGTNGTAVGVDYVGARCRSARTT